MNILVLILFLSDCYFRKEFNSKKGYEVLDEIRKDILIWDLLKENGVNKDSLLSQRKDPKTVRKLMLCDLKDVCLRKSVLPEMATIPVVIRGFLEIVKGDVQLLQSTINKLFLLNEDIYALDTSGKSALFYAVIFNCKEIVPFILERTRRDTFINFEYDSETILDIIVNLYNIEILKMLLYYNKYLLAGHRYREILIKVVNVFIRLKDTNPNIYNEDRMLSIVSIILENGFILNTRENIGRKFYDMARQLYEDQGYSRLYSFLNHINQN